MPFHPIPSVLRSALGLALVAAVVLATSPAPAESPDGDAAPPTAVVEGLHDALLDAMKRADTVGFEGRYERLAPVVDRSFDLDFMAEKAVGRYWRDLTPEEQARIRDVFERFTISTYANRFSGYSGERFITHEQREAPRDTVIVRTSIVRSDGDAVEINYRLHETDAGWRIIDVLLRGTVSELALRRSEYSSVIQRDGFAHLVEMLEQKITDLSEGRIEAEPAS